MSVVLAGGVVGFCGCASVPTGRVGVEWAPSRGTVKTPLGEGVHLVSPFSSVERYDLREQEQEETLGVLADNGLSLELRASILYQPIADEIYQLATEIGLQYYNILIGPYLRSGARKVVGRYSPEEIYSTKREEVERDIFDEVAKKIAGKHVRIDAILIREVRLPPIVQEAIQRKLQEEQRAEEMKYVLEREEQETQRKRIEAAGVADFQSIVTKGLTDKFLEWKGIEATEKLSSSQNAKIVIIGSGKGGLPVILNASSPASP